VFFAPPDPALSRAAFARVARARGVELDRRTQLLYDAHLFYLNGTAFAAARNGRRDLARLADRRALTGAQCAALDAATLARLHQWYCDGYLDTGA